MNIFTRSVIFKYDLFAYADDVIKLSRLQNS